MFLAGISISVFSETVYCIAGSFWKDNFLEILENGDGFQNYTYEIVLTLYLLAVLWVSKMSLDCQFSKLFLSKISHTVFCPKSNVCRNVATLY